MSDDKGTFVTCFMDGIDWQHHIAHDAKGTRVFPSVRSLKEENTCIDKGGCGVVEVEVHFVRWVEEQDLTRDEGYRDAQARADNRERSERLPKVPVVKIEGLE